MGRMGRMERVGRVGVWMRLSEWARANYVLLIPGGMLEVICKRIITVRNLLTLYCWIQEILGINISHRGGGLEA